MHVTIKKDRAASLFFNNKFYDTDRPLDLSFSETFRLSRVATLDATYNTVPYDSSIYRDQHLINFFGDIDKTSGFGGVSYNLIKYALPRLKIALAGRTMEAFDGFLHTARERNLEQSGAMIWHDQPKDNWLHSPFQKNICIVPWETTTIPRTWVERINMCNALFVPCKQNIEAFRSSGVHIPIELTHWGIDTTKFYSIERPERPLFTFGTMGALSVRKGTDLLVDAFTEAFPTEKDVRLICKTSYNQYTFMTHDKRIEVQISPITHEELMRDFFQQIDCFVFPTRGEGWGLPITEAMATGVPAIATNWSGPQEFMQEDDGYLLDHTMSDATAFSNDVYKENCGQWAEPSKEHLIHFMRHAYNNREEVRDKGARAAKRMKRDFPWEKKISMYLDALNKHL